MADAVTVLLEKDWRRGPYGNALVVWLRCAGCKRELRLAAHKVNKWGRVSPDVSCAVCKHEAEYELYGWPAGSTFDPPKA